MTQEEDNIPDIGIPDYAAIIDEQKKVIAAMNDKINALEARASAQDAKITAMSKPRPAAAPAPAANDKSEFDRAYEKVLADLGIKKE